MIGSVGKVVTKLFGKKSDKDIKAVLPLVKQILAEQEKLKLVSNDELRENSNKFRTEIKAYIKAEENQIAEIKV